MDSDSSDRDRPRRTGTHQKKHDSRDTFLGAGAGGILGDAIFPGLGTAAGLILGGLGGRKYAKDKRSRSAEGREHRHRDAFWEGRGEAREERKGRSDSYREVGKEGGRRGRDSGYGLDERDLEEGYGYEEGHKHRGKHRKAGESGWDAETATFKSGTAVR